MTLMSMCGVVLDNGKDCPNAVNSDAPINLCAEHFTVAYEWHLGFVAPIPEPPKQSGRKAKTRREHQSSLREQQRDARFAVPVVYYLQLGNRIKIGTTTNLRARLRALPYDRVLAIEKGGPTVEGRRHQQFGNLRTSGEWFTRGAALLEHIDSLQVPEGWSSQLDDWEITGA